MGAKFYARLHVDATGDSGDIYLSDSFVFDRTGTDANQRPIRRQVSVTLGNHSWTDDHTGQLTWTCDQDWTCAPRVVVRILPGPARPRRRTTGQRSLVRCPAATTRRGSGPSPRS